MRAIGLAGTCVGGAACVLGGLLALFVFLAGGDVTSKGMIGAIGLYFCGKGVAVIGLGLIGSAVPNAPVQTPWQQRGP